MKKKSYVFKQKHKIKVNIVYNNYKKKINKYI